MPQKTPLYNLHQELGGKMVEFAGYELPVQYKTGLIAEHLHTRKAVTLFDVSHMGQVCIQGDADKALARRILTDFSSLPVGVGKYSVITTEEGGILDDCIVSKDKEQEIFMVFNASRKLVDTQIIQNILPSTCQLTSYLELVLIALQGPKAEAALAVFFPQVVQMSFMRVIWAEYQNQKFRISRTGYTGEDGFEISMPSEVSIDFCKSLLALENGELVKPAGLGARDSLRLEAGLALYGQDLTQQTTPIEAGLLWTIPKNFRQHGGFCGEEKILQQIAEKPNRKLVGLKPEGKVPVRDGVSLSSDSQIIGEVTSGGFSPSLGVPIAMGYVKKDFAKVGSRVIGSVRGKEIVCEVVKLPFVGHNYKR